MPGVVEWLNAEIKRLRVEVLVLDPLGAMHGLPENSNEAINLLAGALRDIAEATGAAVVLLHHTSKAAASDMDSAGAGASRGASALVDAVRSARQVVRMTAAEAGKLGVAEADRRDYLRVENGKANMSRAENARWLRMVPIRVGNVTPEYPSGDIVATVERWTPPTATSGTTSDLARVHAAMSLASTPLRLDHRSPDWIGWIVSSALGLDAGGPLLPAKDRSPGQAAAFARVRAMLDGWLRDGGLIRREERDPRSRKSFSCAVVGVPAVVAEAEQDRKAQPGDL